LYLVPVFGSNHHLIDAAQLAIYHSMAGYF